MSKKQPSKIAQLLQGVTIKSADDGAILSTLYRSLISSSKVNATQWQEGTKELMEHKIRKGDITREQAQHTIGNLTQRICDDRMSWKFFMDGIRIYALIFKRSILSIRLQLVVVRERDGKEVTDTFNCTLQERRRKSKK